MMALHEKQHNEGGIVMTKEEVLPQQLDVKPRIQVKNPAELIDKLSNDPMDDRCEVEISSPGDGNNKTTGENALWWFFSCGYCARIEEFFLLFESLLCIVFFFVHI